MSKCKSYFGRKFMISCALAGILTLGACGKSEETENGSSVSSVPVTQSGESTNNDSIENSLEESTSQESDTISQGTDTISQDSKSSESSAENQTEYASGEQKQEMSVTVTNYRIEVNAEASMDGETFPYAYMVYPEFELTDQSAKQWSKLSKRLAEDNLDLEQEAIDRLSEATDMAAEGVGTWLHTSNFWEMSPYVYRADDHFFGYLITYEGYYNGAHPEMWYSCAAYDSKTGEPLPLSDVVSDMFALPQLIYEHLEYIASDYEFSEEEKADIKEKISEMTAEGELVWALDEEGLHIYFDAYDLMFYAFGPMESHIPLEECKNLIVQDYMPIQQQIPVEERVSYVDGGVTVFDMGYHTPNGAFKEYFETGEVENNGSNFVRLGKEVFYRKYNKDGIEKYALWGNFLPGDDAAADTTLSSYHLETKVVTDYAQINASGDLFAAPDGFYYYNNTLDMTYKINAENWISHEVCRGQIIAISDSGREIVVQQIVNNGGSLDLVLFADEKEAVRFETPVNGYTSFCGFDWDTMILLVHESVNETDKLVSVRKDGTVTLLGILPQSEYTVDSIPVCKQFLSDEEGIYVCFVYYEGTAMSEAEWMIVTAKTFQEDSLKVFEHKGGNESSHPRMLLADIGELMTVDAIRGDYELSEGYYGDLVLYDSPYSAIKLAKDFVPDTYGENEDENVWDVFIQDIAVFDQTAFVISVYGARDKSNDIGWRSAYELKAMEILAIPFDGTNLDKEGVPKHFVLLGGF